MKNKIEYICDTCNENTVQEIIDKQPSDTGSAIKLKCTQCDAVIGPIEYKNYLQIPVLS